MRPTLLFALVATPALAELQLATQVPGLDLIALPTLPEAPQDQGDTTFCDHLFVAAPTTPGGRDAATKGWHVTTEAALGDLTAVAFVGSATPATSGTCELLDGNIGLYSNDQLVALLYGTDRDRPLVGSLRPFGDGLRVLSGDLLPGSVADLMRRGDSLVVTPPAPVEPVCSGTASVPAIEGRPIDAARGLLMQSGWQPVPGDPAQQALGWAKDLAAAGLPEVEDCSGTGFALCAFTYAGPAGTLRVVTAGEAGEDGSLPAVTSYDVTCTQSG